MLTAHHGDTVVATFNLSPRLRARIDKGAPEPKTSTGSAEKPAVAVRALIHDLDLNSYLLELRFWRIDGAKGTLTIPRSLTASPQDVRRMLLDAGALLPRDAKAATALVQAHLAQDPPQTREITRRGGWHGDSFVTNGRTFGPQAASLSFVGSSIFEDPSIGMRRGTFEGWRSGLTPACAASSFLTFGLSVGYAGPLLDLLGEDEGAIFNFYGHSSTGKTLIARCLHSQAGRAQSSDLPTYGISPRGAEELCFARNDWAVVFDEAGRTTGTPEQRREKVRSMAFMVPSGRGAIRSARVGRHHDLPNLTWRLFGISSGERPLDEPGTTRFAGEQLRHIDITVPRPVYAGVFDRIEGESEDLRAEAARLAGELEVAIAANYGLARDHYLDRLTAERATLDADVRRIVDDFVERVGASTQPWERRLARKFGIVLAGAVLAAEWEVAPFSPEHAHRCVLIIYRNARRAIVSVEEQTGDVLHRLREARSQGLFPLLQKGEALPEDARDVAWGFRREVDGREIVAVLPSTFEDLAPSKPSAIAVLDTLLEKGTALPGPDGKRHRQIAVQGFPRTGRGRWVCLLSSKI
ncbi:Superfamily II helicase and inactivated derivatives-like protein [Methylorubrum extorquens PA1]|nr:Superfamily II helicase and inactivated derivatives-like protein [Methylorubrum extorquens PA1]